MENEQNIQPLETTIHRRGNSLYLKIPPQFHKHLGIAYLKKENTEDRIKAESHAQKSGKGEHYLSAWNPEHPSQTKQSGQ